MTSAEIWAFCSPIPLDRIWDKSSTCLVNPPPPSALKADVIEGGPDSEVGEVTDVCRPARRKVVYVRNTQKLC